MKPVLQQIRYFAPYDAVFSSVFSITHPAFFVIGPLVEKKEGGFRNPSIRRKRRNSHFALIKTIHASDAWFSLCKKAVHFRELLFL